VNAPWSHDLFDSPSEGGATLAQRITAHPTSHRPPSAAAPVPASLASKALRAVVSPGTSSSGGGPLSIKGASVNGQTGNVVQITGLVPGTTAEDVVAIFKRCGPIVSSKLLPTSPPSAADSEGPVVRITYKTPSAARDAVEKFDGQTADGRVLRVKIVGGASTVLAGRLAGGNEGGLGLGLGLVKEEGSVDVLMQDADMSVGGSYVIPTPILLNRHAQGSSNFSAKCARTRSYGPILVLPSLSPLLAQIPLITHNNQNNNSRCQLLPVIPVGGLRMGELEGEDEDDEGEGGR
jgi:RNA recognition motif-containing protein